MAFDRSDIVKTYEVFHKPGDVVEVRVPKAGKNGTISGYFNNVDSFADAVMQLDGFKYPGVYFTINKVTPDLLARYANCLQHWAQNTTTDKDGIICRRWLPIDLDPVRPAGISSTDEEYNLAIELGLEIRNDLIAKGWSNDSFVFASSGNGAHLMVRIELPYDPEDRLVEQCLKALNHAYSTEKVKVDTTVFNASRIIKIYGTTTCKGSNTENRPHRNAQLFEVPETIVPVSREQLEAFVAEVMPPVVQERIKTFSSKARSFDPVVYAEKHGAIVTKTKPWQNGGLLVELQTCPFYPDDHTSKEISIGRMESGARFFKCQHDSCKDKKWKDLKALWEPNEPLTLADLKLEDLCIEVPKGKEGIEYKLDSDRASKAILSTGELKLASWDLSRDSNIWVCAENNVWIRTGDRQIERICDDLTGSRSNTYLLKEIKRRVRNNLSDYPIEFDTCHPCVCGTKNGYACNLITGEVRKIKPEDYISTDLQLPVDYDPEANCPEMFGYLDGVCITDCERMALIDFDTSALMLQYKREIHERLGSGQNGKGLMDKHQRAFFGASTMVSMPLEEFVTSRFALSNLFRKRILTLPETRRLVAGQEYPTSGIKSLSGGDQRDADRKNKEFLQFTPFCKVVMDANTPPRFDDTSDGWSSRFRRENYPFLFEDNPNSSDIRQKKLDPRLINKITTPKELSGWLNVLLYRAQTIIKSGVTPKCSHLTGGYQEQVYSLEEFIKKFVETTSDPTTDIKDGWYISPKDLFNKFDRWAVLTNGARMKEKNFFMSMNKTLGATRQMRLNGKNQKVHTGCRMDYVAYDATIMELEKALTVSGACGNSKIEYEELKQKFGNQNCNSY